MSATSGKNLLTTRYVGPSVWASALHIRMTKVGCLQCGRNDFEQWSRLHISLTQLLGVAADTPCESSFALGGLCSGMAFGGCVFSYAIKDVWVSATSAQAIVQDFVEAEDNTDARDKSFMWRRCCGGGRD